MVFICAPRTVDSFLSPVEDHVPCRHRLWHLSLYKLGGTTSAAIPSAPPSAQQLTRQRGVSTCKQFSFDQEPQSDQHHSSPFCNHSNLGATLPRTAGYVVWLCICLFRGFLFGLLEASPSDGSHEHCPEGKPNEQCHEDNCEKVAEHNNCRIFAAAKGNLV